MKRILFAISIFLSFSAFAQDAHLMFKGVSMKGNIGDFILGLMDKGFDLSGATEQYAMLEGMFLGTPKTNVAVYPNPHTKNTVMVVAFVEAGETWKSIEEEYNRVVRLYTEKYGEPSNHEEHFDGDADTGFQKLRRVREKLCRYATTWELAQGSITIMIMYSEEKYYVTCSYFDKANSEDISSRSIDDI